MEFRVLGQVLRQPFRSGLAVLLALTGFGVYQAFGPPSKGLTDPFDDHDD